MNERDQGQHPEAPDTWPGKLTEMQGVKLYAANPEDEYILKLRLAGMKRQPPETLAMFREIVEALDAPRFCPRRNCRRAGACADPYVACFMENREVILPLLLEAQNLK